MRGLRATSSWPGSQPGIIPARAGFTATNRAAGAGTPDHPRACGVYFTNLKDGVQSIGSSPRVRGLPWRPRQASLSSEDHPRACGVYLLRSCPGGSSAGSSPRVRGLLATIMSGRLVSGIIPARAGFTGTPAGSRGRRPDHPRACGVYLSVRSGSRFPAGSSPRVRGLRLLSCCSFCRLRIIPARAGFTVVH